MTTTRKQWTSRAMDAIMEYGPCLPLTLTQKRSVPPWVRLLGVLWQFAWTVPAMVVCFLPLMALLFAEIVIEALDGDL